VLPDQLQGPHGPSLVTALSPAGDAAPDAPAWQSGCLILVPGGGNHPAPATTACAAPHPAVVAVWTRP
jgi:hypothetical protein